MLFCFSATILKAFGVVCSELLLAMLSRFGIEGNFLRVSTAVTPPTDEWGYCLILSWANCSEQKLWLGCKSISLGLVGVDMHCWFNNSVWGIRNVWSLNSFSDLVKSLSLRWQSFYIAVSSLTCELFLDKRTCSGELRVVFWFHNLLFSNLYLIKDTSFAWNAFESGTNKSWLIVIINKYIFYCYYL